MNKYRTVTVSGVFLIVCLTSLQRFNGVLDHDVAVFLALSKMVTKGRELYSDILDPNTPAMTAVGLISVQASELSGLALDQSHLLILSLILAACLSLSSWLFLRAQGGFNSLSCTFILLAALALFVVPGSDFGRREHLMFACLLPWLVTIFAQPPFQRHRWETVAAGLTAGFGLFLKPHFILFALAISGLELYRAHFRLAALSKETWLAGLASITLYSLFIYREPDYLNVIIPYTSATYGHYQHGFVEAVRSASPRLLPGFLIVLVGLQIRSRSAQSDLIALKTYLQLSWVYALTGLLVIGLQGLGFSYHALPIRLAATMAAGTLGFWCWQQFQNRGNIEEQPRVTFRGPSRVFTASLTALVLAFAARDLHPTFGGSQRDLMLKQPLISMLNENGANEYAYFFSTSISSSSRAAIYADTGWAGHMISMYFLPIIADYAQDPGWYPAADAAKLAEIERYSRARILDDMLKRKPTIVLFDNKKGKWFFKSQQFDYLSFLQQDAAFAKLWREMGYQRDGVVKGVDVHDEEFQVYRRQQIN